MASRASTRRKVLGVPDEHEMERLAKGIVIDGRKTAPAEVKLLKVTEGSGRQHALLSIVVHEGRNRQVRRMCEAVGHPVDRLKRVRIGPITDDHIRPGEFRELDTREVAALKKAAGNEGANPPARTIVEAAGAVLAFRPAWADLKAGATSGFGPAASFSQHPLPEPHQPPHVAIAPMTCPPRRA